jgi:hypothetical protein
MGNTISEITYFEKYPENSFCGSEGHYKRTQGKGNKCDTWFNGSDHDNIVTP